MKNKNIIIILIKRIIIKFIFSFSSLFYSKKYLTGIYFSKDTFSIGWSWFFKYFFFQKIIGINRDVPWIVSPNVLIGNYKNIFFHVDDLDNFISSGTYFQGINGKIFIGKGTKIGPNVGLINSNHDKDNLLKNLPGKDIIIGEKCWIGMNSVILPGVILGNETIVGAGSIVTKSFNSPKNTIVGNPARKIK